MYATNGAPARARWEVLWIKNGRVIRKDCGHDLAEALRVHGLAVAGERKNVTLRCKNMGFPPPDKYADKEEVIVRRNGKRYRGKQLINPRRYRDTMDKLNRRGIWWCPYCMKLRRFVKRKSYRVDGVKVQDTHYACPMCGASHRLVLKYNPVALRITVRGGIR